MNTTRVIRLTLAAALLLGAAAAAAQNKVYRWVDEDGEVHYSETLPPDFEDKTHDVLDEQGIERARDQSLVPPPPPPRKDDEDGKGELPRDKSGLARPEPLLSPEEMRAQQDALLLLRYDSEQEILDAMQVEINQLDYDRHLLTGSRKSLEQAYRGNVHEAANRQRAGLPVEDDMAKELRVLKRRLLANAQSLAGLEKREAQIREMFATELERYRNLVAKHEQEREQG